MEANSATFSSIIVYSPTIVYAERPQYSRNKIIYELSLSNDNNTFSSVLKYTVYNSNCYTCASPSSCELKPKTCEIDGVCIKDGDYNPKNDKQKCISSTNPYEWSLVDMQNEYTSTTKPNKSSKCFPCDILFYFILITMLLLK